ncbi:hypothetical protein BG004_006873 [Podila humilis]|nr:hypothetical protein BG004_006873 [Podila humilis]
MSVSWALALFLNNEEHKYEIRSSNSIFIFFVHSICATTLVLHTLYDLGQVSSSEFRLNLVFVLLTLAGFTAEAWPRGSTKIQQRATHVQAIDKANLFSKLIFHFYQPIVSLAARQEILYPADIANQIPESSKTGPSYSRLSECWSRRVSAYYRQAAIHPNTKKPTLFMTIVIAHRRALAPIALIKIIQPITMYLTPAILGLLLDYVENSSDKDAKPLSYGVGLAMAMFLASMVVTLMNSFNITAMYRVGAEVKVALTAMIYCKSLRLSPDARKSGTAGQITNHVAVDAEWWEDAITVLVEWISIPIEFAICLTMLYQQLGWSFSAGLAVIVALVPIQVWRATSFEHLEENRMKATDERIRITTEVLSSIKIVKLYGWEEAFKRRILQAKRNELNILYGIGIFETVMFLVFGCSTILMSLAAFSAYVTISKGVLTPKIVFVSIALFDMLHEPVSRLAEGMTDTISIVVATNRLQRFFFKEEIDPNQVIRMDTAKDGQDAIEIKDATLSWTSGNPSQKDNDDDNEDDNDESDENQPLLPSHNNDESGISSNTVPAAPTKPALENITLMLAPGTLTAVVGRIGQGKSSLLSAIIGEMYKLEGSIAVRGRIAYVPQQAWIVNATLRDNILFGKAYDQDRYRLVIQASGLEPDLAMLPGGDMTEIGERGINLSGGQKQRVSLARAAYQDADIYLLDDPLSAVDAHVDNHLWQNLIGPQGLLRDKTRLLVTHGIHHLDEVDQIVVLKGGQLAEVGKYEELMVAKRAFYQLIYDYSHKHKSNNRHGQHRRASKASGLQLEAVDAEASTDMNTETVDATFVTGGVSTPDLESGSVSESDDNLTVENVQAFRQEELGNKVINKAKDYDDDDEEEGLIAEEIMKKGGIEWRLFKIYVKAAGIKVFALIMLSTVLLELCEIGLRLWLKHWAGRTPQELASALVLFLGVHSSLTFAFAGIGVLWAYLIFCIMRLQASETIHERLLSTMIRLPMSFYDTTPLGRIVNRFSTDLYSIDEHLPWKLLDVAIEGVSVIAKLIVISVSLPQFLVAVPFIVGMYYAIQWYFLWATRSLKRIKSVAISPVYQHFDETLNGLASIRAMDVQDQFISENAKRTDYYVNSFIAYVYGNRWVEIRLQTVSALIILIVALLSVFGRRILDPGLVGLALSYAVGLMDDFMWLVRDYSECQSHLVAVERVQEYTEKNTEAPQHLDHQELPSAWPTEGKISFKNYSARYREGLDLVVKHLSFDVLPCEKIGIVGRTGAGKSSLTLSLFRIIEAANSHWAQASDNSGYLDKQQQQPSEPREDEVMDGGTIEIDGIDIASLGLTDLRRHLSIIPQDPTLFAGNVRDNLDPFQEQSDVDLWEALARAHLKDYVRSLPGGLTHEVAENGENFSVGQRSLICLARALLRKSKILILDEATAAVDVETDELIQRTIRKEFQDRTVLTIAHRIKTIMDSDKILVMEQGQVVEFAAPRELLSRGDDSMFYKLAHQAGEVIA